MATSLLGSCNKWTDKMSCTSTHTFDQFPTNSSPFWTRTRRVLRRGRPLGDVLFILEKKQEEEVLQLGSLHPWKIRPYSSLTNVIHSLCHQAVVGQQLDEYTDCRRCPQARRFKSAVRFPVSFPFLGVQVLEPRYLTLSAQYHCKRGTKQKDGANSCNLLSKSWLHCR